MKTSCMRLRGNATRDSDNPLPVWVQILLEKLHVLLTMSYSRCRRRWPSYRVKVIEEHLPFRLLSSMIQLAGLNSPTTRVFLRSPTRVTESAPFPSMLGRIARSMGRQRSRCERQLLIVVSHVPVAPLTMMTLIPTVSRTVFCSHTDPSSRGAQVLISWLWRKGYYRCIALACARLTAARNAVLVAEDVRQTTLFRGLVTNESF